jgi:hypothetical protein
MGGVAKQYIIKLGCEKYFCRVTYILSTGGDALNSSCRRILKLQLENNQCFLSCK